MFPLREEKGKGDKGLESRWPLRGKSVDWGELPRANSFLEAGVTSEFKSSFLHETARASAPLISSPFFLEAAARRSVVSFANNLSKFAEVLIHSSDFVGQRGWQTSWKLLESTIKGPEQLKRVTKMRGCRCCA